MPLEDEKAHEFPAGDLCHKNLRLNQRENFLCFICAWLPLASSPSGVFLSSSLIRGTTFETFDMLRRLRNARMCVQDSVKEEAVRATMTTAQAREVDQARLRAQRERRFNRRKSLVGSSSSSHVAPSFEQTRHVHTLRSHLTGGRLSSVMVRRP